MLAAGYTAVGEFHYLGFEQALAAAEAAAAAGITFVLLYAAYARGGLDRFRQASPAEYLNQVENLRERGIRVGLAPHSVRACPPDWLARDRPLRRRARSAAARPRRRAAARDRGVHRGARHPADRAPREDRLPRPAHDGRPRDARRRPRARPPRPEPARASAPAPRPRRTSATASSRSSASSSAASRICIGSDSNVRIDPLEELRELEGIARRPHAAPERHLARHAALGSAPTKAPRHSGSTRGRTSRSTSSTPRWPGSTSRTPAPRSSSAARPTSSSRGSSRRTRWPPARRPARPSCSRGRGSD